MLPPESLLGRQIDERFVAFVIVQLVPGQDSSHPIIGHRIVPLLPVGIETGLAYSVGHVGLMEQRICQVHTHQGGHGIFGRRPMRFVQLSGNGFQAEHLEIRRRDITDETRHHMCRIGMRGISLEHCIARIGNAAVIGTDFLHAGIVFNQVVQVSKIFPRPLVIGIADDFQWFGLHGQVEHTRRVVTLGLPGGSFVIIH